MGLHHGPNVCECVCVLVCPCLVFICFYGPTWWDQGWKNLGFNFLKAFLGFKVFFRRRPMSPNMKV